MIKQRKWKDWTIYEDTETGEKMFTLPAGKLKRLPIRISARKTDEVRNQEEVRDQPLHTSLPEDKNEVPKP